MSYNATAIKVMIASPSDVPREREIIRDVIHEWNAIYSEEMEIVLMPVGWETHASPEMGARAQEIINKQVLLGCDVLVATFWTRIGSPTGDSPSGTVEEIREHVKAGKPAMIYFSSAPVMPDSIDQEQYSALKAFREECLQQGLVETYESLAEFRTKLARHLAQTVLRCFSSFDTRESLSPTANLAIPEGPQMSDYAKQLLITASEDTNGIVMKIRTTGGLHVQTQGRQLVEDNSARSAARWEAAVNELCEMGFLEAQGYKSEIYRVTQQGYEMADRLREMA